MTKPDYVYVTYIATTPEKIWQALVDPDVMSRYWFGPTGCARVNVSEWKPGSRWEHRRVDESRQVDIAGTVEEVDPPRRLAMTWARPAEVEDPSKHSRVTFDVEPQLDGLVKLTVTHSGLEFDPRMLAGISNGWPLVLSNLKTLLETGRSMPRSTEAH